MSKKLLFRISYLRIKETKRIDKLSNPPQNTRNLISTLNTKFEKPARRAKFARAYSNRRTTRKIISREEEKRIVREKKSNEECAIIHLSPKSGGRNLEREREENRDKPAARNSRSCNTLEVVGWYACDYLLSHRRINDESPMGKPVAGAAERHAVLTTSPGPSTRAFQRHEFAPRRELMETRRGMRRALIKRNAPSFLPFACISLSPACSAFTHIFALLFFPPPPPPPLSLRFQQFSSLFAKVIAWTRFPAGIRRNQGAFVMVRRACHGATSIFRVGSV